MRLSAIRTAIAAALVGLVGHASGIADARAATLPFAAGAGQGLFLHVGDIHFDPFYDPAIVPRLIAAPVEQWQDIFRSSTKTGFAQYGSDANYPLLMSMLSEAEGLPYDYVLNTGDSLAHGFRTAFRQAGGSEKDYESFVIKTMLFVDRMLKESFPGVPHPTEPNHDIVVLSDVFWSIAYLDNCNPTGGDPGSAELAWLQWTLYQEKLAGRSVSLVMHIPPGINAYSSSRGSCPGSVTSFWQDGYASRFLALVGAYKDLLRGSYAGHTHMDDFRVLADATGTPFLTTRITPAVSPVFNNNPAFTVLLYNRADAAVANYATFHLSNLAKIGPTVAPEWAFEYAFEQAYGYQGYNPTNVLSLSKAIRANAAVRKSYMQYYAAGTPAQSPINAGNWTAYACAQTAMTPGDYATCLCPSLPPDPGTANAPPP